VWGSSIVRVICYSTQYGFAAEQVIEVDHCLIGGRCIRIQYHFNLIVCDHKWTGYILGER
jgi:hypothetical protein